MFLFVIDKIYAEYIEFGWCGLFCCCCCWLAGQHARAPLYARVFFFLSSATNQQQQKNWKISGSAAESQFGGRLMHVCMRACIIHSFHRSFHGVTIYFRFNQCLASDAFICWQQFRQALRARTHAYSWFFWACTRLTIRFHLCHEQNARCSDFFFSPTILLIVSAHWFACQFFVMHLIFIILNWYVRITNLFIKFINRNVFGCGYAEGMILCVFTIHWQLWLHAKLMVHHPFGFMFKLINVRT